MNKNYTYEEAVAYFGSGQKLAERLGISHQAVYQWKGKIPEVRQYHVNHLINSDLANAQAEAQKTAA